MDDHMDALGSSGASSRVANALKSSVAMEGGGGPTGSKGDRGSSKDKSDRATVEQAIDPRTRMVLFKVRSNLS
jgi:RIO kinase 1